jgi:hypothetical protein
MRLQGMQRWGRWGRCFYGFEFQYTRGAHRLEFRKVTLMRGDQVVARNEQAGHSGIGNSHNLYRFTVPAGDASEGYSLHAEIKSDGGTDSYGEITVFKD